MALARMILSGLFDRYPRLKIAVAHMGGGLMFGTDYGPVPIDPREHIDIVNGLAIAPADKEMILWRNAARFFNLSGAA